MAFRPIISLISILCLILLVALPAHACFGPKLFVGVGQEAQEEVLFALVTLYVQEKTGVESNRVDVAKTQRPVDLITDDKVDLVFIAANEAASDVVFQIPGRPSLATGPRPMEDLQFTTVLPAIRKLNRLLTGADVDSLVSQVEAGESAMAAARKFLMKNRWI